MNMQALMKQAQKLQGDMKKAKEEIDKTEFFSQNGFVKVKMNGKKEVLEVIINAEDGVASDDVEVLQDMILLAMNDGMRQVDKLTEEKMGKLANGMPGIF